MHQSFPLIVFTAEINTEISESKENTIKRHLILMRSPPELYVVGYRKISCHLHIFNFPESLTTIPKEFPQAKIDTAVLKSLHKLVKSKCISRQLQFPIITTTLFFCYGMIGAHTSLSQNNIHQFWFSYNIIMGKCDQISWVKDTSINLNDQVW